MAKVSLRAYNREIETMIDRGHLDEAIANCRHILKTYPKHLETYRLLGKAYLEYKKYPEAADILARVLAAVPDDFVANVGMSIIRDEENRLDDAIWHMERAFETQPSNAAIQGELQRLYGRRDGVQPPRIRMTRGALAHMYVQGELYPQAISEIKSVLNEDGGRVDMQALLARAYYRSGLKNDAADVASSVLHTYPNCLDANRVLMEILGSDRSESAQIYRQRVVELDPYAAHVTGTVFHSNEAPEAAVNLERLDWNGQPVSLQPDWESTEAISLEADTARSEQPDWLKSVFEEPAAGPPQPSDSPTIVTATDAAQDGPKFVPAFDSSIPPSTGPEPAEDIPAFLREAGWAPSSSSFDESKSPFRYEEPDTEPPLAKGELPDWVKAMAPVEAEQPAEEEEEKLPDWINMLGTGVASTPLDSEAQPDWMSQLDQSAQPADDRGDWQKQTDLSGQMAPSNDQPDWLTGFGSESGSMPAAPPEQTDWMSQLGQQTPARSESQPSDDQLDWLKHLDEPAAAGPAVSDDQPDWLKGFGEESVSAPAASPTEQAAWFGQPIEPARPMSPESSPSELESPAALDAQPQPVPSASPLSDIDFSPASTAEPEEPLPSIAEASMTDMGNLGTSEQEREDSFAWLENLAVRQGASEGLLTQPEDRLEEEPDWVKRAKGLSIDQAPAASVPASQPAGNLEDLGKSEQERDDSFAWLENLAARQGASEGLLTRPEDRLEQEPDWVRQARDLSAATEQPADSSPAPAAEVPSSTYDTAAWLRSLDEEKPTSEPAFEKDTTAMWLKSLDDEPASVVSAQPSEQLESDLPAWMQTMEEEQPVQASAAPTFEEATAEASDWMGSTEESTELQAAEQPQPEPPAWMQHVEEEKASEPEPIGHEMEAEEPIQFETMSEQMQDMEIEQPAEASMASLLADEVTAEASDRTGWIKEPVELQPAAPAGQAEPEMASWMRDIEEAKAPESESMATGTGIQEIEVEEPAALDEMPEWMQFIEDKEPVGASAAATGDRDVTEDVSEWIGSLQEPVAPSADLADEKLTTESQDIPAWLSSLEEEETRVTTPAASDEDLPSWLRGEEATEPELERTRAADWQPLEEKQAEQASPGSAPIPEAFQAVQGMPEPVISSFEHEAAATPEPEPYKESAAPIDAAISAMPVDPILGRARADLSSGNIPGALNTYGRLIRKKRLLDEVVHDLRDSLYRFPVDVGIWQALGDAYMRANRLQDALDAYTKAEELLR